MDSVTSSDLVDDDTLGDAGRQVVGSYKTYLDAQRAVDRLSDASFPVESVEIVGRDLRFVEKVTGRMSSGRAAAAGAGSGAWFGLFVGLLVGLFTPAPDWIWLILIGVVVGAIWGAVFGYFAYRAMRGHHDFTSASGLAADRYDVMVLDTEVERARRLVSQQD